ncbi:hypothetical protein CANARDRAFT_174144 [[Candida] arabinofermentans NRRL YB-2248]|uniref:Uncharacterized protein n=1 Tax=[Candida] arabinofermentans NRRL YB-2248 TaxID=983967 RepID=A0A1E4T9C6_9ASCO|nr:hypothetical protein CANARDRAFT_174144 [[Candida] arabinofermentans NRRL YB-2248]
MGFQSKFPQTHKLPDWLMSLCFSFSINKGSYVWIFWSIEITNSNNCRLCYRSANNSTSSSGREGGIDSPLGLKPFLTDCITRMHPTVCIEQSLVGFQIVYLSQ